MPQLLRNIDQDWQIVEDGVTHWHAEEDWRAGQPLQVSVDSEPDPAWLKASAIAVNFPALTDGRGLSLAVLLHAAALHWRLGGAWQRPRGHRSLSRQKRIQRH